MDKIWNNKDKYKIVVENNNIFDKEIKDALALTKHYIIENNLILYGGFAMHLLLKTKGDKIYDDKILPDYDVYSPNHIKDSYKFADILHKKGFKNVSSISAMHITSRRVRVNFQVVMDVSYMPKEIFDNAPFVLIEGIKVISPYFQQIDLHISLTHPYLNPPNENIFNRFNKDIKRLKLMHKYFELKALKKIEGKPKYLDFPKIKNVLYGGLMGFNIIYWFYNNIFGKLKNKKFDHLRKLLNNEKFNDIKKDFKEVFLYEPFDDPFLISPLKEDKEWDTKQNVVIYSDDIFETEKHFKKDFKKYYAPFMESRPRTIYVENKNIEIQDIRGSLVPFYDLKNYGIDILLVNTDLLSSFLLQRFFKTKNEEYLLYYYSLQNMNYNFSLIIEKFDDVEILKGFSKNTPFLRNLDIYGEKNFSSIDEQKKIIFLENLNRIDPDLKKIIREPFGYYPKNNPDGIEDNWPDFNIENSIYFKINGQLLKTFEKYIL